MDNQQIFPTCLLANFEKLSAVLAKVPPERVKQVDAKAAIFISGMEAAARAEVQPTA